MVIGSAVRLDGDVIEKEFVMRKIRTGLIILAALTCGVVGATAQSFEVGPGGVRVSPDSGPRVYQERRGYDDRPRYDDRDGRRGGGLCARLRDECENGERGEGNCRRYRRTCG